MKRAFAVLSLIFLALWGTAAAAQAVDFSHWAVLLVAGDDRAHSGAPSKVFDNARRDLARAFAGIGFSPDNMLQFSVDPEPGARPADIEAIAESLWDLTGRARDGCLVYFTSHGAPDGIVVDDAILPPREMRQIVRTACGRRPSVIVMSACFSGQFVPALAGPNRFVFTAARRDRTSFGCGESDRYTFFDQCFLQSLPASGDFPGLAEKTRACVARREREEGIDLPSEPQLSIGRDIAGALSWH